MHVMTKNKYLHIYYNANPVVVTTALLTLLEPSSVILVSLIYFYSFGKYFELNFIFSFYF